MTQKIEVRQTDYVYTIAAYCAAHVQTILVISITILLPTYVSETVYLLY